MKMRRTFLILGCLVSSFMLYGQDLDSIPRNEIKANILYTLLEVPEFTYERLLGPDGGLGVSVGFGIDEDIGYRLGIVPYYRFYFGKEYASGFFLELNTILASVREEEFIVLSDTVEEETRFTAGLGVAAGVKFLTRKNWVGEVYLGFGRYLSSDSALDLGYPRIGISLGKRF